MKSWRIAKDTVQKLLSWRAELPNLDVITISRKQSSNFSYAFQCCGLPTCSILRNIIAVNVPNFSMNVISSFLPKKDALVNIILGFNREDSIKDNVYLTTSVL